MAAMNVEREVAAPAAWLALHAGAAPIDVVCRTYPDVVRVDAIGPSGSSV